MDQKKQGHQSEEFTGQQQGSPKQGSEPHRQQDQPGQQNWNEPQTQNPNREPAEGPRRTPGSHEKGGDVEREQIGGRDRSGGISNRDLDQEMAEQEELPDRKPAESEG